MKLCISIYRYTAACSKLLVQYKVESYLEIPRVVYQSLLSHLLKPFKTISLFILVLVVTSLSFNSLVYAYWVVFQKLQCFNPFICKYVFILNYVHIVSLHGWFYLHIFLERSILKMAFFGLLWNVPLN